MRVSIDSGLEENPIFVMIGQGSLHSRGAMHILAERLGVALPTEFVSTEAAHEELLARLLQRWVTTDRDGTDVL